LKILESSSRTLVSTFVVLCGKILF